MTRLACKICVLTRGITLRDTFATEAELTAHIEKEHTVPPAPAASGTPAPSPLFARGRSDTGRVPVAEATRLLQTYGLLQVIIVAWDGKQEHVTTDGATLGDGDNAAEGGNLVKRALNWPPERYTTSGRVAEFVRRVAELCSVVERVDLMPDERAQLQSALSSVREAMRTGWRP